MGYIKCPRCDLNYIREEEEYCDVCKAELKFCPQLIFAVDEDEVEMGEKLCPFCKRTEQSEDTNTIEGMTVFFLKDEILLKAKVEDEEVEQTKLCPICKHNYIKIDEDMCSKCADEMDFKKDQVDFDKDEEWKNFIDEEDDDAEEESEEMLSLNKLVEEEGDEMFEEDEEEILESESVDPDDFDIPEVDASDFEDTDEFA